MNNTPDLNTATLQEIFDFVATHLMTQLEVSKDAKGSCRYRHYKGDGRLLMCAAGCLLAESVYNKQPKAIEGDTWTGLVSRMIVPERFCDDITRLQELHDHKPVSDWPDSLIKFATNRGLDVSVVEEFV